MCLFAPGLGTAQEKQQPIPTGAVIRTSTQEVVLDLVVRDSKGRFVKNLQQSDVEILEDGVKQDIRSFRLVQGRDVLIQDKAQGSTATVAKASGNPLHAVNLVCIVFHNLDPYTKKYAVEAAQEFIKNDMTEDTWVAIFALDTNFTVLHQFTRDKNALLQAANNAFSGTTVDFVRVADAVLASAPNMMTIETVVNGNPAAGGTVTSTMKISGGEVNTRAIGDAAITSSPGANAQRGALVGQRQAFGAIEGQREADSVLLMIGQLNTLPGRKSVLFMSPGMPTTGDTDMFKMIVDKATKSNVTVYALDVNGLAQNSNTLAANGAVSYAAGLSASQSGTATGAAMREKMRQSDYIGAAVRTSDTQAAMRGFAEGTGGFLIGNTNDLRKPFQKVAEEVETHYEAIYHPSSDKYDGRLRTIEVKLDRPELSVSSRTGYFAMPYLGAKDDVTTSDMLGLAALNVKTPPHAFEFKAAAFEFRPEANSSVDAAVIELPTKDLTFTPEPGTNRYRMHVSVLGLIKDSNGQVVDKFNQDSPYQISDDNLQAVRSTSLNFSHPLNLPAGRYTMDTAVVDHETNRASIKRVSFGSQERKGVGLSSVMLVKRVEPAKEKADASDPFEFQAAPNQAQRIVPELATTFAADTKPSLFFVVYPDPAIAEKPKVQVSFLVGGKLVAKQESELPAPDSTGAIPMVIQAATRPGDCELRITAMQGNTATQRSISYTISAAAPTPTAVK
jgi:VWFA-related protein